MSIVMFIILICGQPDIVTWYDKDGPHALYWSQVEHDPAARNQFLQRYFDPNTQQIVVPDERGICV
jgi:hypothetical protein